jgi:PAS domain S-box-containing protein
MSLRRILLVLCLLSFLSAATGGALYFSALRRAALHEAERKAFTNLELIHTSLNAFLTEHRKPVATLASIREIRNALRFNRPAEIDKANIMLDQFVTTLDADVCYLMDQKGLTIASSNRDDPDSFVGQNFAFRPYFRQALEGRRGTYLALGTTSGKRGVYHSFPVRDDPDGPPIGVAVIKSSIEKTEKRLGLPSEDIVLVNSPEGVIFISNRAEWLFQLAWDISPDEVNRISAQRQFGVGPWTWVGLQPIDAQHVLDQHNRRYLMHQMKLDLFEGWQIVHLSDMQRIGQSISAPLLRIVGPVVLLLTVLVGICVLVLYQKASGEIRRRLQAEQALRESEIRYRSLYHHTPAMLHSIDPQGNLLSVSDYWAETMGYAREEVVGRPLTDFFTPATREYAQQVVFPQFFREGVCKDINYQFVKKNGDVIEASMSAIADRDGEGRIRRSMAVSIDVTQRNRAEEALRLAKEELSRYSKELERQVSIRTGEISAILKHSPNVVYFKDTQGRYLLVNTRYEEIFGVHNEDIRGKTHMQVLPPDLAEQFQVNDERARVAGRSINVEEQIPQEDGPHIYLSVKFPIYDEPGHVRGVCGIATDITPLKKAQEQLRRLSGSIMASQEKERTAIARELHDELGQLLTALRMDGVWLQERLKVKDTQAAKRAGEMCALIDTTIEEVRAMAIRLRPGVLDDLGLVAALEWSTTEIERRGSLACIFTAKSIPPVDGTVSTVVYRIAQEALTNVARHAGANRVEVCLAVKEGDLFLEVSDDGCGFEPERISEGAALGLAGMHERATLVGGCLNAISHSGQGTVIQLRVPLPPQPEVGSSLMRKESDIDQRPVGR